MALSYAALSISLLKNRWKTDSEFQFAALRISLVVLLVLDAADAVAFRVKRVPNMEELIPAYLRVICGHLAIKLEVTALCGFMNDMNIFSSS